jgi:glucose/arabinose dehydrogenase
VFAVACGSDDGGLAGAQDSEDEPPPATQESSPTPVLTPTSTVVVPGVSRGDEDEDEPTPTPDIPSEPPTADNVSFPLAFPNLHAVERPIEMVEVPGQSRFLLILQEGRVLSFASDPSAASFVEVLDWRNRTSRASNEEGLLGIALSPDFERDGYVYLYYSARPGERRSTISRFNTSGTGADLRIDPGSELVVLEVPQPFPNHNGGQIAFGHDGMLYIALGDGGSGGDPLGAGQDRTTLLGSILRVDVSNASASEPYRVPDDNPFVGHASARPEIWAYGLRNPWRFSFDMETGTLWAADVGQNLWEEVNIIERGGNYGWNIMEGFSCYGTQTCDQSGLELPVLDYANAGGNCSVTGGYVGRGTGAGLLNGYYVYGDYCSGRVWAVPADSTPGSQPEPITLRSGGPNLPGFSQGLDGRIYIMGFDGRIYTIES